ncbi:MAG: phage tail protein [Gaiellales bacterium]
MDEPQTSVLTVAAIAAAAPEAPPEPELRWSPPTASARGYLRAGLPSMYTDPDRVQPARGRGPAFGLALVGGLEEVLDPVVAVLDCLPSHLVPEMAPSAMVGLIARWLGLEVDESWPVERRRQLVRNAPELARRRGTRAGMELALRLIYPELPLRVVDNGAVVWAGDPAGRGKAKREFIVYCDAPLPTAEQAKVAHTIDRLKPVGVPYKLRVKQPPAPAEDPT